MSSQEYTQDSFLQSRPGPSYEKICCLFLNWTDGIGDKNDQILELKQVLHDKYGAFETTITVDHTDLEYSEKTFWYSIENFIKENDSRSNLLVIFYSGCSYVHENQLFLEPHRHTEPNVRWSETVDRRIFSSVATILLIFDTTCLREGQYDQLWKRISRQLYEKGRWSLALNLLSINGAETRLLVEALRSMAFSNLDGFTVTELCKEVQVRQSAKNSWPVASVHRPEHKGDTQPKDIVLLPLSWAKLSLYEHTVFKDPHDQYLKDCDPEEIHRDGTCEVSKVLMGPDIQDFSSSLSLGLSCKVAIKKFHIKGRRHMFMRDDFLRERANLVEVSKRCHDHLLGMFASFETKGSKFDTLNIILPFAGGGNLYNFLRLERDTRWEQYGYPISDPSLRGCLVDWRYAVYRETVGLVDALAELHDDKYGQFMIHCDIKPTNVLIQKGTFKLADFGLSRLKDSDETSKTTWYLGTAMYSPPEKEILMGRGRDIWALGCVLLEIAFMIRYAFQPELVFCDPDIRNIVDDFKMRREMASREARGGETAIYHRTMGCVHENMEKFSTMRPGLRRMICVDGLLPIIRKMLEEDQRQRINAFDARKALKAHYLTLQSNSQLQQDIQWRDNPGGPSIDWDGDRWSEAPPNRTNSTTRSGKAAFQFEEPRPRLFMPQQMSSSFHSTGATPQLHDLGVHERKRSSSAEESSSNKRRWDGLHH